MPKKAIDVVSWRSLVKTCGEVLVNFEDQVVLAEKCVPHFGRNCAEVILKACSEWEKHNEASSKSKSKV